VAEFDAGKIIAQLEADKDPFIRGLEEATAEGDKWASKEFIAKMDLDTATALAKVDATIAEMKSELAAADLEATVRVAGPAGATIAQMAAAAAGGRAGTAGFVAPAAAAAAGGRGGDGRFGGGLANMLGFGAAASGGFGRIPFLGGVGGGLAGFGTLGSYAGLGVQSMLTTGLGIAGSALGAAAGAGALGLGTAGVLGVGMGTDLAGIGQAAGDIRATTTAMTALNTAVQTYGASSTQAATAQAQLNTVLSGFSPVARTAVVAASATIQQFKAMFDFATGAAEKTGAQIIQQVVQVGEKFLPTVGKYATQNMSIIQGALQPLFSWIQGPGLSIFQELERTFQQRLPEAMHALTQGVELLVRVFGFLAPYTGRLLDSIDKWVTLLNTADFGKLTGGLNTAIGVFRQWEGLAKAAATAVYELWHRDAQTGTSIVTALTHMIDKFNAWIQTAQGGTAIHNLLEAHKQEILAILQLLPQVISIFGRIDLLASPYLMHIVAALADMAHWILETPLIGKLFAMALAFEFMGRHMSFLTPMLKAFNGLIGDLARGSLVLLGGVLTRLGGPFAVIGGWLTRMGTKGVTDTEKLTLAIQEQTVATQELAGAYAEAAAAQGGLAEGGVAKAAGAAAPGAAGAVTGAEVAGGAVAGEGAAAATTLGAIALPLAAIGVAAVGITVAAVALGNALSGKTNPALSDFIKHSEHMSQNTAPQLEQKLGALTKAQDELRKHIPTTSYAFPQPGLAGGLIEKQVGQLGTEIDKVKGKLYDYNTNVKELSAATGLAAPYVKNLANQLGINLVQALTPDKVHTFTKAIKDSGGAAGIMGQQWQQGGAHVVASLELLSAKAAVNMPHVTASVRNMVVATQPHLLNLVTSLNKTGDKAAASLITSFVGNIPKAELASKTMHDKMHSPLLPLEYELEALGDKSAAKMIAKFIAHHPDAEKASKGMHDAIKNPLAALETSLAASGNIAAAQYIQQYVKRHPEAKTAAGMMHDAVHGSLQPLEWELQHSGAAAAANFIGAIASQYGGAHDAGATLGAAVDQGLASGITSSNGVVINSVQGIVQTVITAGRTGLKAASPSMVFYELGRNVAQGLALGINDHAYLASDATGAMTMGLGPAARSGARTATNALVGQSSPMIHIENVHFQDKTDMAAFMNMADFYLQQRRTA
jgi:hypothetical protein